MIKNLNCDEITQISLDRILSRGQTVEIGRDGRKISRTLSLEVAYLGQ